MSLDKYEMEILRPIIKGIIKETKNSEWSDLKESVLSYGVEDSFSYPESSFFFETAKCEIFSLDISERKKLVVCWNSKRRFINLDTDEKILSQYARCVLDVIVSRAIRAENRSG